MNRTSVREIVKEKMLSESYKSFSYKSYSLAVDHMVYSTSQKKSGSVGNVLFMIDKMKEESAVSRARNRSNKSELDVR